MNGKSLVEEFADNGAVPKKKRAPESHYSSAPQQPAFFRGGSDFRGKVYMRGKLILFQRGPIDMQKIILSEEEEQVHSGKRPAISSMFFMQSAVFYLQRYDYVAVSPATGVAEAGLLLFMLRCGKNRPERVPVVGYRRRNSLPGRASSAFVDVRNKNAVRPKGPTIAGCRGAIAVASDTHNRFSRRRLAIPARHRRKLLVSPSGHAANRPAANRNRLCAQCSRRWGLVRVHKKDLIFVVPARRKCFLNSAPVR